MKIGTPNEVFEGENRVAMTPDSAKQLQKLGYDCLIEAGAGLSAGFVDKAYADAGVTVVDGPTALWEQADIIASVSASTTCDPKVCAVLLMIFQCPHIGHGWYPTGHGQATRLSIQFETSSTPPTSTSEEPCHVSRSCTEGA